MLFRKKKKESISKSNDDIEEQYKSISSLLFNKVFQPNNSVSLFNLRVPTTTYTVRIANEISPLYSDDDDLSTSFTTTTIQFNLKGFLSFQINNQRQILREKKIRGMKASISIQPLGCPLSRGYSRPTKACPNSQSFRIRLPHQVIQNCLLIQFGAFIQSRDKVNIFFTLAKHNSFIHSFILASYLQKRIELDFISYYACMRVVCEALPSSFSDFTKCMHHSFLPLV